MNAALALILFFAPFVQDAPVRIMPDPVAAEASEAPPLAAARSTRLDADFDWLVTEQDRVPTPAQPPRLYNRLTPAGYEPLPDWALDDPLRYAAQQCRPQVRPEGEEVEACMARVEGRVRTAYAERNPAPPHAPQASCRRESRRYADNSGGSSQVICGTGEASRQVSDWLNRD